MATVVARAEAAIALTTLSHNDYIDLFKAGTGVMRRKVTSCYPREGGRPVYGPALPDYDHPHLCADTIERLVLVDDGKPPKPAARFGPRMSEKNGASGGHDP